LPFAEGVGLTFPIVTLFYPRHKTLSSNETCVNTSTPHYKVPRMYFC